MTVPTGSDSGSGSAVAPPERKPGGGGRSASGRPADGQAAGDRGARGQAAPGGGRGGSFFEIYKPGQGRYTRMGTAIGGGMIILGAGNFLYESLNAYVTDALWSQLLQYLLPLGVVVGLGLVLYWVVGVNRTCCDFFIATEGEMKKVSWSTRNELIGSTKVVIWFTVLLGGFLFCFDAFFIRFFEFIGVLRTAGS